METAVRTTEEYLNMLRRNKQIYCEMYGVTRIGIFGSVARGEQTESSDVDVYFEADDISLFRMGGLLYDLQELFNSPVDLVHNSGKLHPKFQQRIDKEIIYV